MIGHDQHACARDRRADHADVDAEQPGDEAVIAMGKAARIAASRSVSSSHCTRNENESDDQEHRQNRRRRASVGIRIWLGFLPLGTPYSSSR